MLFKYRYHNYSDVVTRQLERW